MEFLKTMLVLFIVMPLVAAITGELFFGIMRLIERQKRKKELDGDTGKAQG